MQQERRVEAVEAAGAQGEPHAQEIPSPLMRIVRIAESGASDHDHVGSTKHCDARLV